MDEYKEPLALTIEDVVKQCQSGRTKIFAEIKSGRLRSYKLGRSRRFTPQALREWQQALIAESDAKGGS